MRCLLFLFNFSIIKCYNLKDGNLRIRRGDSMGYKDYKIGDRLTVKVAGVQKYGVFANLDADTKGLIHISEIKHGYIEEELKEMFEVGEELSVVIIDIDEYDGKISLSTRALEKVAYHPFSNRKTNPRYGRKTGTGFSSLEKKLTHWLNQP